MAIQRHRKEGREGQKAEESGVLQYLCHIYAYAKECGSPHSKKGGAYVKQGRKKMNLDGGAQGQIQNT